MGNNLSSILDVLQASLSLNNSKKYWLVRTDDGRLYSDFVTNAVVGLRLVNYPVGPVFSIINDNKEDREGCLLSLKNYITHANDSGVISLSDTIDVQSKTGLSRLVHQIYDICFGIKRGDIVIIPDRGASRLSIGRVIDDNMVISDSSSLPFSYYRKVKWIKTISKDALDPYLYKALGAHQAVCNISRYAEIIERNYNSFFAVDNQYSVALTINSKEVSAYSLMTFLREVMDNAKGISEDLHLGVDINDVACSVYLNSPGKFSFKGTIRDVLLVASICVVLCGGTLSFGDFNASTDGVFKSLVECVSSYQNQKLERDLKEKQFDKLINSLDVKSVEDWNAVIEQETNDNNKEDDDCESLE